MSEPDYGEFSEIVNRIQSATTKICTSLDGCETSICLLALASTLLAALLKNEFEIPGVTDALESFIAGGIHGIAGLVLDDSDRERYAEGKAAAEAASTARIVFRSGPDETTAWRIR